MVYKEETIAAKNIIKTHYIVRVMDIHPETQTVDVMQDSLEYTLDPNGDKEVSTIFGEDIPVSLAQPFIIFDVPVKQERWGQFSIQCCPSVGDTGYIEVFTDDTHNWLEKGIMAEPNTTNKFEISNCVFVPFLPSFKSADPDYPKDNTKLIIKSKNVTLEIVDDEEQGKKEINVTAEKVNVTSDINITGNVSVKGDITQEGAMKVTGTISATKEIKSDDDVKAGTVSLKSHTHDFTVTTVGTAETQTGSGTTATPK